MIEYNIDHFKKQAQNKNNDHLITPHVENISRKKTINLNFSIQNFQFVNICRLTFTHLQLVLLNFFP